MSTENIKDFYTTYHDWITSKRYHSLYWIRRYANRQVYESVLKHIDNGKTVLDAGCGEGVLSVLMAQKGVFVTAVDISSPNVFAAQQSANQLKMTGYVKFLVGDVENLPFADNSFDIVVSSHVLEHLSNFYQGLNELYRITRHKAVIALPTCLNPCAWVLLGKDSYWAFSKRSLIAIPLGITRTLVALCRGVEGPDEGYAGHGDLPHVWRFPWVVKRQIREVGFNIVKFEASTLLLPYLAHYISPLRPIQMVLDRLRCRPLLNLLGYGSVAVCYKD